MSYSKANINGKPVGLITLKSFNSNTRDDVMHALEDLHKYVLEGYFCMADIDVFVY